MNRFGKSASSLIIAGISILLVAGALITTLAQSGFSPTLSQPTNTAIQIESQPQQETATFTLAAAPSSESTQEPSQTQNSSEPTNTPSPSDTTQTSTTATQETVCEPPSDWIKYTVKSGDTLFSIATLFQTTYQTLQSGNCMWTTRIYTGDTLYVPDNATITPTTKPTKAPTNTTAPTKTPTNTATTAPSNTPVPTATFTITPTPTATPPTCYVLTLTSTGPGTPPSPNITNSEGCDPGYYIAGEVILLTASADPIDSWYGNVAQTNTSESTNTLTMPASDHEAGVNYTTP